MMPPPFILGCTLIFWGWQSQLIVIAIPMALSLESTHWLRWRVMLSDKEFNRIADLSTLLGIAAIVYLLSQHALHGLLMLMNWLPILFFPLLVAQRYSIQGTLKLSSLFLSLRQATHEKEHRFDLSYPYMMSCLLATSIHHTPGFFGGSAVLIMWALWTIRPQRYPIYLWLSLLIGASCLAYLGQQGLYHLQMRMEDFLITWFERSFWRDTDPYRRNTALGEVGKLKQSNRIVLRVASPRPLKLRKASYNSFFKTLWQNQRHDFIRVPGFQTHWSFVAQPIQPTTRVHVTAYLSQGKGILALPHGVYRITDLPLVSLAYNRTGSVKVEQGPDFIKYTAYAGSLTPLDMPPTEQDLYIFPTQKPRLAELIKQLQLDKVSSQQIAVDKLTAFFNKEFRYSLALHPPSSLALTPVENFLFHHRSGHCEYFATATVLLLRVMGIPARYATGYAVEEFSRLENLYIVRQRHAHAWALAYLNDRWQAVDTTPADWLRLEAEQTAWWLPFYDVGAWLNYQFSQWRWRQNRSTADTRWLLWLTIPLGLILAWRFYQKKKVIQVQQRFNVDTRASIGTDSSFYQVVHQLSTAGFTRFPGETLAHWLNRIPLEESSRIDLHNMLCLHQRYRFDPINISPEERAILNTSVVTWLKQARQKTNIAYRASKVVDR